MSRLRGYYSASDFRDPESYHRYMAMSVELSQNPPEWDRPPRDEEERIESQKILDALLESWGSVHVGNGVWKR